jgi:hypothetical protein
MKKLFVYVLLCLCITPLRGQELDTLMQIMEGQKNPGGPSVENQAPAVSQITENDTVSLKLGNKDVIRVIESRDSTFVQLGANEYIVVEDLPDSTNIRIGKRDISIVDKDNNAEINVRKNERYEAAQRKFKGHWAGFGWGFNNLLDDQFSVSRDPATEYLDINSGRSWVINLNFAQYSVGFGTPYVGLVTGLGFEFSNYFFNNDVTIIKEGGEIAEVDLSALGLKKSKLVTTYLRLPVILEAQFPGVERSRRASVGVGVVGALRLGSHTKYVYKDDNGKEKEKSKGDFYLNTFRYGVTARIGYRSTQLFFDYYFTSLFADGRGPELYPFSVGLAATF